MNNFVKLRAYYRFNNNFCFVFYILYMYFKLQITQKTAWLKNFNSLAWHPTNRNTHSSHLSASEQLLTSAGVCCITTPIRAKQHTWLDVRVKWNNLALPNLLINSLCWRHIAYSGGHTCYVICGLVTPIRAKFIKPLSVLDSFCSFVVGFVGSRCLTMLIELIQRWI